VLIATKSHLPMRQLAVMQIAQHTGDRYRDLDEPSRARALRWLQQSGASDHYQQIVKEGGERTREDETAIFGESLPLGIRLAGA
jgi:hypothetical protein